MTLHYSRSVFAIFPLYSACCSISVFCEEGKKGGICNSDNPLNSFANLEPSKDLFYIKHSSGTNSSSSFSILYDVTRRTPKWVVEYLRKPEGCSAGSSVASKRQNEGQGGKGRSHPGSAGRRKRPHFHAERAIDVEEFRTKPSLYKNTGYDRGHMVPAADFTETEEMYKHTFSMANICPQVRGVNRGVWRVLESWAARLLHDNDVRCISGDALTSRRTDID
mmetsp:Transcript_30039/g.55785  ORF Transcript_30039/g.55785 Transcript_30039/m.55785 type:complete len:221 (-) Transcript_30039:1252-1914(-)